MSDVTLAILSAEEQRCAAMIGPDMKALEALLDPSLYFCHSSGAVDTKSTYLAKMAQGRIKYLAIEWNDQQVIELNKDAGLLTGRMMVDVGVNGTQKRLYNQVLMAWIRDGGDWHLLAFQSTPLSDA